MNRRELPALVRAVPARIFQRPPRSAVLRPLGGATFIDLVRQLPPDLLELALTHSSWVDCRVQSYERLEFLGDSVLGLAVASTLWQRYPDSGEGELARLKAFVVSRASCVQVAERVGVGQLILERAPAPNPKRKEAVANQTILGNVLEALIGAVFLTHGFEQARLAVIDAFEEQMSFAATGHVDHKTCLQELVAPRRSASKG
jgi:ribonuclease-3